MFDVHTVHLPQLRHRVVVTSTTMKIILLIYLIPYLVTGRAELTNRYFEDGSELSSTTNTFNTLVKNKKTSYVTTNASSVEVIIPITSELEMVNVILGNSSLELDISTTNGTMIAGIQTVVSTSSISALTTLEIDIITSAISELVHTVVSESSAAPVDKLKLEVILESSNIYFGDILTSNVTTIEADAAEGSTIKEIITRSRTKKGSTTIEIELISNSSSEFSSTPLTSMAHSIVGSTKVYSTTSKSTFSTSEGNYSNVTTGGLTTRNSYTDVTSSVSPTSGYCDREYSCADCNTARVCAPTPGGQSLWEVTQFSCPVYAPWCDSHSGTCSTVRTPECDLPVVGNFTCMRSGHFPDPNSCSDYYVCDNDVPLEFTCLYLSPYYSPQSQSCSNSSSDCVDYLSLCKDKSGLKVPVPRVNNLFLYCEDGTVVVVDRCIGAYRFDFDLQECVPECPHAGLFPRDDDCAGYYRCSPSHAGDHYIMTNLTCSQGLGFSESAYDCIDRTLVPNCNATYIS